MLHGIILGDLHALTDAGKRAKVHQLVKRVVVDGEGGAYMTCVIESASGPLALPSGASCLEDEGI